MFAFGQLWISLVASKQGNCQVGGLRALRINKINRLLGTAFFIRQNCYTLNRGNRMHEWPYASFSFILFNHACKTLIHLRMRRGVE